MSENLTSQVVLVTGAGRGIGGATARLLAARGASVGVFDIDGDLARATADAITATGGKALAFVADASDRNAVFDAAAALARAFGPLTGIVNDAIFIRYGPVEGIEEDVLDRMFAVGVKGAFWGVQALLAHRGDNPAAVVNLASPVADLGTANTASYTAVKGAIVALTRQLAVELGPKGVRVNAVAPGAVPTPGARAIVDEAGYAKRRAQTPLGRLGEEDEIAAAIAFLLGPDASFITGEILHADGGITVKSM
ncbi:MAG: SDR family oxidoreductase [Alphaproteobacteria bacterium]|nr:SDR family oxidoreductase [Alphaproteobacteria bacterium]